MNDAELTQICNEYYGDVSVLDDLANVVKQYNEQENKDFIELRKVIIKSFDIARRAYILGTAARKRHPEHERFEANSLKAAVEIFKKVHADLCFEYSSQLPWGEDI